MLIYSRNFLLARRRIRRWSPPLSHDIVYSLAAILAIVTNAGMFFAAISLLFGPALTIHLSASSLTIPIAARVATMNITKLRQQSGRRRVNIDDIVVTTGCLAALLLNAFLLWYVLVMGRTLP